MSRSIKINKNNIILQIVMLIVTLIYLVPTFMSINYALKDQVDMRNTTIIQMPTKLFLGNFTEAMKQLNYFRILGNTTFITFGAVLLIILLSSMAAYSIARSKRKSYKALYVYFLSGILVPYQVIFVPLYVLGRKLGFVNNLLGVIIIYTAAGMAFGIFMMTGFMKTVPIELEEAAIIDGCSVFKTFFSIIFPLLKPAVSTLAILQSFLIWNDFLMPLLFLQKMNLSTLTLRQYRFFEQFRYYYNTAFAAIIVSTLPIVILFVILQKNFIKGIAMGAVKG